MAETEKFIIETPRALSPSARTSILTLEEFEYWREAVTRVSNRCDRQDDPYHRKKLEIFEEIKKRAYSQKREVERGNKIKFTLFDFDARSFIEWAKKEDLL